MNPFQYLQNSKNILLKQHMYEILKERYEKHDQMFDRISMCIQTDEDLKNFGKIIADVFEVGYLRAIEEHKQILTKLGYKVNLIPSSQKQE